MIHNGLIEFNQIPYENSVYDYTNSNIVYNQEAILKMKSILAEEKSEEKKKFIKQSLQKAKSRSDSFTDSLQASLNVNYIKEEYDQP